MDTIPRITVAITTARNREETSIFLTPIPIEHINVRPDNKNPIIYFDLRNVMSFHHHDAINNSKLLLDPYNPPPVDNTMVFVMTDRGHLNSRLTRDFLYNKQIG